MRTLPPMTLAVWAKKLVIGGGQAFFSFVVAPAREVKKDQQDIPLV